MDQLQHFTGSERSAARTARPFQESATIPSLWCHGTNLGGRWHIHVSETPPHLHVFMAQAWPTQRVG
jgi:hypothetical protein